MNNQTPVTAAARAAPIRVDLQLIADMVEPGCRLLDVGCGDGALLRHLVQNKSVDGRGIEISREGVNACVREGLSVIQGDADTDLADYPDDAFDMVVLSQTCKPRTTRGWSCCSCCASAVRPSSLSPILPIGTAVYSWPSADACR